MDSLLGSTSYTVTLLVPAALRARERSCDAYLASFSGDTSFDDTVILAFFVDMPPCVPGFCVVTSSSLDWMDTLVLPRPVHVTPMFNSVKADW